MKTSKNKVKQKILIFVKMYITKLKNITFK